MSKRTYYSVNYGRHVAKFSDHHDAMAYARRLSEFTRSNGEPLYNLVEVVHASGVVGQYHKGETTPEFQGHHEYVFHWERQAS